MLNIHHIGSPDLGNIRVVDWTKIFLAPRLKVAICTTKSILSTHNNARVEKDPKQILFLIFASDYG